MRRLVQTLIERAPVPVLSLALALSLSLATCARVSVADEAFDAMVRDAIEGDREAVARLEQRARGGAFEAQLVLAQLRLDGIGVAPDVAAAFGWLCLAAHHDAVDEGTIRAAWLLAEYFRTGGGVADRRYAGADIDREDPLRAYFWYSVLREMGARDAVAGKQAATLGAVGRRSVSRSLYPSEREAVDAAAAAWKPRSPPPDAERCLALPGVDAGAAGGARG